MRTLILAVIPLLVSINAVACSETEDVSDEPMNGGSDAVASEDLPRGDAATSNPSIERVGNSIDRLIPSDSFHVDAGQVIDLPSAPDPMAVVKVSYETKDLPDGPDASFLTFGCGSMLNQDVHNRTKGEVRIASEDVTGTCTYTIGTHLRLLGQGQVDAAPNSRGTIGINRIEVSDPKITDVFPVVSVKGTYSLSHKTLNGYFDEILRNVPTGTGYDVGNGEFQVVTDFWTPSGQQRREIKNVTFK